MARFTFGYRLPPSENRVFTFLGRQGGHLSRLSERMTGVKHMHANRCQQVPTTA